MLCGIPPFYNDNLERMYELIKLCDLRFPKRVQVSADAKDLISKVNRKINKFINYFWIIFNFIFPIFKNDYIWLQAHLMFFLRLQYNIASPISLNRIAPLSNLSIV